jgi:hypothetical protein
MIEIRGYGYSMAEGLLHAGGEWGLQPAGERAFTNWLGMTKVDFISPKRK